MIGSTNKYVIQFLRSSFSTFQISIKNSNELDNQLTKRTLNKNSNSRNAFPESLGNSQKPYFFKSTHYFKKVQKNISSK